MCVWVCVVCETERVCACVFERVCMYIPIHIKHVRERGRERERQRMYARAHTHMRWTGET